MSEAETDKGKIKPAESFEHDKQNVSWLKKELDSPILQQLGGSGNQLTNEKHTDEKPMKGIVMSSVAEFSITDTSSKGTKNEKKLSAASTSSIASLEKCREFTYIEDDASVHQRDSDDTTRPPTKTMPTTIAIVTVTLIAAFLSPAMRLVNAWNLPWRFQKFATANRKISDKYSPKLPESELSAKDFVGCFWFGWVFTYNNNNQSVCQPGLPASCCSHPGGL
ncbi:myoD family inhibitor domain-containing protein 2 isoform X1 [Melanerpes formicivorus]|uniref:myoD family inhibitor domain-containing protein 2 isoform X1 n=1 Tax=Melanerpes formicivorus TaxID=211600 RepID=UPI00358FEB4F